MGGSIRASALAAALLLHCVACAPGPEPWHAEESFTAEERAAIVEAEAWITQRVGRPSRGVVFDLEARTAPADCPDRCLLKGTNPGGVFFKEPEVEAYVVYLGTEGRIITMPDGSREAYWLKALVAHELGHYYGLRHHEGQGVMNPEAITFNWTSSSEVSCWHDVLESPYAYGLRCAPSEQP